MIVNLALSPLKVFVKKSYISHNFIV